MTQELNRALGRVEGKLDSLIDLVKAQGVRTDAHDKRLSSLERWRTWSAGVGATVAGLLGIGHLPKL